jgi:hypothetical protein
VTLPVTVATEDALKARRFVSLRLPRTVTLHRDVYDDSGLSEGVTDYDRRRDAIHYTGR